MSEPEVEPLAPQVAAPQTPGVPAWLRGLGRVIKRHRVMQGMSQRMLAGAVNKTANATITASYINVLEKGIISRSIGVDKLLGLAQVFGVTINDLLQEAASIEGLNLLPEEQAIRAMVPLASPHPLLVEAIDRFGIGLNATDWARVAGYIRALAEERTTG